MTMTLFYKSQKRQTSIVERSLGAFAVAGRFNWLTESWLFAADLQPRYCDTMTRCHHRTLLAPSVFTQAVATDWLLTIQLRHRIVVSRCWLRPSADAVATDRSLTTRLQHHAGVSRRCLYRLSTLGRDSSVQPTPRWVRRSRRPGQVRRHRDAACLLCWLVTLPNIFSLLIIK